MPFRSWLVARARPGQRDAACQVYRDLGVLQACQAAVPGFISGELLESTDDPDALCVTVLWADEASFAAWQASPLRAAQTAHLLPYLQQAQPSVLFRTAAVHGGPAG